jgi:hypothetical protein
MDSLLNRNGNATHYDLLHPNPYEGNTFQKRGDEWASVGLTRASHDGRYLMLQSFSGPQTFDRLLAENRFKPLDRGKIFLDAFDAASGRKAFGVEGTYREYALGWLGSSGWLGDRFFVLSLEEYYENALICDLGK